MKTRYTVVLTLLCVSVMLNAAVALPHLAGVRPDLLPWRSPKAATSDANRGSLPVAGGAVRTRILNRLIEKFGYQSYLEVGQGDRAANFDHINCRKRIGVDPDPKQHAPYQMTSDEFFSMNEDSFDLIFVDGLHHADQVERDIANSLAVLNGNGTIVVHDCNPATREMQLVPPVSVEWTGDVWKAWVRLRATRPDLSMAVVDADHGCGIIRRGAQALIQAPALLTYEDLARDRQSLLNLVDLGYLDTIQAP